MTGAWLASYLALFGLDVGAGLGLVAMLRRIGLLQQQLGQRPTEAAELPLPVPPLEHDGPPIGSHLPDFGVQPLNDFGPITPATLQHQGDTLLVFMSPLCEGCQHTVTSLNALAKDGGWRMQPIVIMRADEHACRAFLTVFPLCVPMICDADRAIHIGFDIHRSPFSLLYGEGGGLVRKGITVEHEDFLALSGDASMSVMARAHVFPQPHPQAAIS